MDSELYIPHSWTTDADRCRAAGISENRGFATKPELAIVMIERFLDTGHHASWAARDAVYGGNRKLRAALEGRGLGYVLPVVCSAEVTTQAGKFRIDALADTGGQPSNRPGPPPGERGVARLKSLRIFCKSHGSPIE